MLRTFHTGHITHLAPGECFVFGSNLAGRHGAGAARQARLAFGAQPGVGEGSTGQCYALPSKSEQLQTLAIEQIAHHVAVFLAHARAHPEIRFLLTAVGCGLAGYAPHAIAPLFAAAPSNVVWPPEFRAWAEAPPDSASDAGR
jgi:hypothetical protein